MSGPFEDLKLVYYTDLQLAVYRGSKQLWSHRSYSCLLKIGVHNVER